jgi:hypothetical protein
MIQNIIANDRAPWALNDNTPDKHQKILNHLAKIATAVSPVRHARLASCVTYKGMIIAYGTNKFKSHPFQKRFGKNSDAIFLHSEVDVLCRARRYLDERDLSKATLYVCRVKYDDFKRRKMVFGMAKPCIGCERALASFGMKNVIYTLDEEGYDIL